MSDSNVLSTAAISGVVAVIVAAITTFTSIYVARSEIAQRNEELLVKRRGDRLASYQKAIDLLTDWEWRRGDRKYDKAVVREFTLPFVHAANQMRVYGSPATIAAMDEIQIAFGALGRTSVEAERVAAEKAIHVGLDHLVIAAREDVGPQKEDHLRDDVSFHQGAGPTME